MIAYTEKGKWLISAIGEAGYWLRNTHNPIPGKDYNVKDEDAIQAIIDSFDPLPFAQSEAKEKIKEASFTKRLEFVTDAPGKDAEYRAKQSEAEQYEVDATVGVYMQARVGVTGEATQQVADVWNAKSVSWRAIGAQMCAIEDKAMMDLGEEADWTSCSTIANAAIAGITNVSG